MSKTIKVTIVGATGYTGLELIRLVLQHPNIKITHLVSQNSVGQKMSDLWPHLAKVCELTCEEFNAKKIIEDSDCVFLALPHLESQRLMPQLLGRVKIFDLAGDFRLKDPAQYPKYYGKEHIYQSGLKKFVYGVPEFFKKEIAKAHAVANPGCFAIASELALYPLAKEIKRVAVFGVTGSSGSGKAPKNETHHPVRGHNLASYKIGLHQHLPEIIETTGLDPNQITFIPTSGPFSRGILLTAVIYLKKTLSEENIQERYKKAYGNKSFVRLVKTAAIANVVGSNYCDLSITVRPEAVVVQTAIDNLCKGAAGNAIQNFNIIFNLLETTGLEIASPLFP